MDQMRKTLSGDSLVKQSNLAMRLEYMLTRRMLFEANTDHRLVESYLDSSIGNLNNSPFLVIGQQHSKLLAYFGLTGSEYMNCGITFGRHTAIGRGRRIPINPMCRT